VWYTLVLFCHVKIFQAKVFHAMLLISLKSSQWVEVHWFGLRLFGVWCGSYWLLNLFFHENKIKSKLKTVLQVGATLVLLESPQQVRIYRFYFTIFRAIVWRILIFEWILLIEIQTNCKNWVHSWANGIGYTRPNGK